MTIVIIGRGHSGTRIISRLLKDNGIFMGNSLNNSFDKLPANEMYKAVNCINEFIDFTGTLEDPSWDFSKVFNMEPTNTFVECLNLYLKDIRHNSASFKGWKIPETVFILPWLLKLIPEIKYIVWWRHPYDATINRHKSDKFGKWKLEPIVKNTHLGGAISWYYQYLLIQECVERKLLNRSNMIEIKYEDFCQFTTSSLLSLSKYVGKNLSLSKNMMIHDNSCYKYSSYDNFEYNYEFLNEPIRMVYKKVGMK